jgi:CBS domain-containing protein
MHQVSWVTPLGNLSAEILLQILICLLSFLYYTNGYRTLDGVPTGKISGVISERDYISKIALLGRVSKDTLVKEISTKSANLLTASPQDSVDQCMEKMLSKGIRHLPLLADDGNVIGMLSVSGLVWTINCIFVY